MDKRTNQLSTSTANLTALEDYLIEVDKSTLTEAENIPISKVNAQTRTAAGLNLDGTYKSKSLTNYIKTATSIDNATVLLDAKAKLLSDDLLATKNDFESRIQNIEITLTDDDIKSLRNEFEIIPSPGQGKAILVLGAMAKLYFSTIPFNSADVIEIKSSGSSTQYTFSNSFLTANESKIQKAYPSNEAFISEDKAIVAWAANDPTNGNSSIKIFVSFRIINL